MTMFQRKLAHHASVDRINYCDKVNNFLVQNGDFTKTYVANKVTSSDYSDVGNSQERD